MPSPMLATPAARLPTGADWTYEVKWDGYRTLAALDAGSVRLFSRNLKDVTKTYPSVARAVATLRTNSAVLDGEVVALDDDGRPSFQALHHGANHRVALFAFDLLRLNGDDLTGLPLATRRNHLTALVRESGVLLSEALPGSPADIERAIRGMNLEGVVAKRASSRYEAGRRSPSWIKVRFNRRQEFVIGGWKPAPVTFESILVGYHQARELLFAAKVRAGFKGHARSEVYRRVTPDVVSRCPFANLPNSGTGRWGEGISAEDMTRLVWVRPKVVVAVEFVEWTRDGLLRHPQFVALRDDKRARDVRREPDGSAGG